MNDVLTTQEAVEKILATKGTFFTVEFTKKSNGELRKMNARLGVTKHLKGGTLGYDPIAHALIGCYDMNNGYRMINVNGLLTLSVGGVKYDVVR